MAKRKSAQPKRRGKQKPPSGPPITFRDYLVVIEHSDGTELKKILKTDYTEPPDIGEGVRLHESEVRDAPQLAGSYLCHFVDHAAPPDGPVTIAHYTIPWCYVRRRSNHEHPVNRDPHRELDAEAPGGDGFAPFSALTGNTDVIPIVAEDFRALATELDEERDVIAAAVRASNGQLDPKLPDRLHRLSRLAKRRYADLLLNYADGAPPKDG